MFQRAKEDNEVDWDAAFDGQELERKGEYVIADALRTVGGGKDISFKYQTTYLEGVNFRMERVGNEKGADNKQVTLELLTISLML